MRMLGYVADDIPQRPATRRLGHIRRQFGKALAMMRSAWKENAFAY